MTDVPAFDRLTRMAASLVDAPVAVLVACGVDGMEVRSTAGTATDADVAACQAVLDSDAPLAEAGSDGAPRAWLGAPLRERDGSVGGALCVVDAEPRRWTDAEVAFVGDLAALASTELHLLRAADAEAEARSVAEAAAQERGEARDREHRARLIAERAVRTLRRLQAVTTSLSEAVTPGDVAAVVVRAALDELDADGAVVAVLDAAADELALLAPSGFADAVVARYQRMPVATPLPIAACVRGGRALWVGDCDEALARYPELADHRGAPGAFAAVPLLLGERVLGALYVTFGEARTLGAEERTVLVAIAEQAAQALDRARLFEAERGARAAAEGSRFRLRLLARAGEELAASLDPIETLQRVCGLVVGPLVDFCAVHLLREGGRLELAEACHVDADMAATLRTAVGRPSVVPTLPGDGDGTLRRAGWGELDAELPERLLTQLTEGDPDALAALAALEIRSGAVTALAARGRVLGVLTVARTGDRRDPFSDQERHLLEELARRAATALDTAESYRRQREVAVTLQHSLLPRTLPVPKGGTLAHRYLAASAGVEVGGDWYDALVLPDDVIVLVVGDVMGHGVHAAAVMGQLRAAVRAYALEGHGPARLLELLNAVAAGLDETTMATCVVARYDPATRVLDLASAGHPPPLLVHADGRADLLPLEPGLPLGVADARYTSATLTLPAATGLLLYSDGLVEDRQRSLGDGLVALRAVAAVPPVDADALCARVLAALVHGDEHDDDVALLALVTPAAGAGVVYQARLALDPVLTAPAAAREFTAAVLHGWGLDEALDGAELIVSELVTNAVRHARTPMELTLGAGTGRLRVAVADGVPLQPVPSTPGADEGEGGRGLWLVAALSARWGVEDDPGGKRVWAELPPDGTQDGDVEPSGV